jgi:hypothetical protein
MLAKMCQDFSLQLFFLIFEVVSREEDLDTWQRVRVDPFDAAHRFAGLLSLLRIEGDFILV